MGRPRTRSASADRARKRLAEEQADGVSGKDPNPSTPRRLCKGMDRSTEGESEPLVGQARIPAGILLPSGKGSHEEESPQLLQNAYEYLTSNHSDDGTDGAGNFTETCPVRDSTLLSLPTFEGGGDPGIPPRISASSEQKR